MVSIRKKIVAIFLLFMFVFSNREFLSAAWKPSKPIELIVPAGKGGGADQLAQFIAKFVKKNNLSNQPVLVINKPEVSGAEGYIYVKEKKGDPHVIIVSLSNIFTLPIVQHSPFSWEDLTPIACIAKDEFVLWVHSDSPYQTCGDYLYAVRASPGKFKMGGTGSAQEDQIITTLLEKAAEIKFIYVPMSGGGEVAEALVSKKVDSTVNNPSEAIKYWKEKKIRPLAIMDKERMSLSPWNDIPTMSEKGYNIVYLMMRGIFGSPGMSKEATAFYENIFHKISTSKDFQTYLKANALKGSWMTGDKFVTWLEKQDSIHKNFLSILGLK